MYTEDIEYASLLIFQDKERPEEQVLTRETRPALTDHASLQRNVAPARLCYRESETDISAKVQHLSHA